MEDITYMRRYGVEEAYLLLIDSSQRDKRHDKHPNNYDVVFTTPFRNVVGIDIVTASIPRTQYVIEDNSNTFTYRLLKSTNWTTITMPTGDYAITNLVNVVNTQLAKANSPLTIQAVSSPATIKNKIQIYSQVPFVVNMSQSTMRRALGFNEPPTTELAVTGAYDMPPNYLDTDQDTFYSNISTSTGTGQVPTFSGPQASEGINQLPVTATRFVRQKFVATSKGAVTQVALYATIQGILPSTDGKLNFVVTDLQGKEFATGTVPVPNPPDAGLPAYLSDTTTSAGLLLSNETYYLIFYDADMPGDGSDDCYNLFSTRLLTADNTQTVSVGTGSSLANVSWSDYEFTSEDTCVGVQVTPPVYQVTSPGLYDLTGERYINVRCSQIEDHMFGARAYEKYNVGMAKIDLGVFGYSDSRFDFSSLPPRRFHPISRLNRLSFRFERLDGSLYNFYGVDHTMVLSVRYLVTDQSKTDIDKIRILNPNYNPNLQDYISNRTLNYHDEEDVD